jgi:2,3-bisphosphoglycerate-dependent phosphoglycerate mutase
MQLYIIRHCQSQNNELWRRTGSSGGRAADPPLTATGFKQAKLLAQHLGAPQDHTASSDNHRLSYNITYLYCSLMRRSIETGLAIAEATALPLVVREDIHERGGIYLNNPQTQEKEGLPGPNRFHFQATYPNLILPKTLGEQGWWNRPYEDRDMALSRAAVFLHWLIDKHDGTEDPLQNKRLGTSRDIWLKANNGSITRLDFMNGGIRLAYMNRIGYLPAHLIT